MLGSDEEELKAGGIPELELGSGLVPPPPPAPLFASMLSLPLEPWLRSDEEELEDEKLDELELGSGLAPPPLPEPACVLGWSPFARFDSGVSFMLADLF